MFGGIAGGIVEAVIGCEYNGGDVDASAHTPAPTSASRRTAGGGGGTVRGWFADGTVGKFGGGGEP